MNPPPAPPASFSPPARVARARRWTRRLPWLGAALLIALIVVGLWPQAQPVELGVVSRGPLQVTVNEEGMTRVKNRYVISSPVGGLLRRIDWKAGAAVEAGRTVLAVLDTRGADLLDARSQAQAQARVQGASAAREQAAAQLKGAQAVAQLATTEFDRIRRLFHGGSVSQQEFDAAELRNTTAAQDSRAAAFGLQVADFELAQARAVLMRGQAGSTGDSEPLVITSPVNGRVLRVFQESERVVPAGFALLEVGDPTDLEARIEVLSREAVAIAPGAPAELLKWGATSRCSAACAWLSPPRSPRSRRWASRSSASMSSSTFLIRSRRVPPWATRIAWWPAS
ncbi:MAG: efflux RND transporter periplasmic adaptor subunit [Opitutales bacterium]